MASNKRTPKSVLTAPHPTVMYQIRHNHANRTERRAKVGLMLGPDGKPVMSMHRPIAERRSKSGPRNLVFENPPGWIRKSIRRRAAKAAA